MVTMQKPIQIIDITQELNKLWQVEHGQKKIRASLFSLIVYVQKTESTDFYNWLIKSVVSKFPCRVILIVNDTNPAEEYLKTAVSSETIGEGEQKFFCEIIQIDVAGSLIERVPYMILPHILPDLPIYLLWMQDPTKESVVLPHLEPFADRIIFDSQSTDDLQNYSRSVLSLMKRFHCNIGDLNWSAISGWRRIFDQVFNDRESFLSLAQSNRIKIQYSKSLTNYQKHTEIKAAYFQAWLASRLNWKFRSIEIAEDKTQLNFARQGREVEILLTPQLNDKQLQGAILGVEIESEKDKGQYIFKKHPQTRQVFIQYSEKDFCQLPFTGYLGASAEGQEIIEEIFYPSGGEHYNDMLKLLSLIPWRST